MLMSRAAWFEKWLASSLALLGAVSFPVRAAAETPPAPPTAAPGFEACAPGSVFPANPAAPESFTRATAIGWALQNNPDLAALRQQHGFAAAAVVIAETYPFNPSWTNKLFAVNGPEGAGITNRVAMEQAISLALEIRGQGRYRRQAATAGLSRTDWEIANQELLLAIRVTRAFDTLVYDQAKLQLAEEALRLQEETAELVRKLFKGAAVKSPDLILARSEVDTFRIALNTARTAQTKADNDFRAALGMTSEPLRVQGTLTAAPTSGDPQALLAAALEQRPDLHARQAALREADGHVRLAMADRYGNPDIRPDYEYNETRVNFIGVQVVLPLPVLNTHRGDILQREAARTRAALDLRALEVAIQQQLHAALSRLSAARDTVEIYQSRVLPDLEAALKEMETLFRQGGADLLRVFDIRRKLLQARSGYLDALYELRQARTDLAAAVGDPGLTLDAEPGD
jgi:cobalt-zinc-cadmium efflux system outer membrane protein